MRLAFSSLSACSSFSLSHGPAVHALALVGDFLLSARNGLVVLVSVLVDVDLDALDARLGLRQHRAGFEIGDALLERLDAVEQRRRVIGGTCHAGHRGCARHLEGLQGNSQRLRLVRHRDFLRRPFEPGRIDQQDVLTRRHLPERKRPICGRRRRPVGGHAGHVGGHGRGARRRQHPERHVGAGDDAAPGVGHTATDRGRLGRRPGRRQQDGGTGRSQTESTHSASPLRSDH